VLVLGDAFRDGGVGEDDEAEATGAAGVAVPHDDGLGDFSEAAEVVAEALLVRLPGDAAYEELPGVSLHGRASSPPLPSSPCNPQGGLSFIPAAQAECGQSHYLSTTFATETRGRGDTS
jgi:hypothetical protein